MGEKDDCQGRLEAATVSGILFSSGAKWGKSQGMLESNDCDNHGSISGRKSLGCQT